jgi:MiaB/RimO family radical SAM methylthiotransferase
MPRTVCIAFAGGCSRAKVDTALLFDYFEANGWTRIETIEDADLVVVTSCGVDQSAEDVSIRLVQAADRRRRPDSSLAITGCLAGIFEDRLREEFGAVVVPPRDYGRLDELIGASTRLQDVPDPHAIEPRVSQSLSMFSRLDHYALGNAATERLRRSAVATRVRSLRELGRRGDPSVPYTLRVAWGCLGTCSYCAIRAACGPLRSKPLDAVLAEFDAGLDAGSTEFRLVAQDLGAYGQDVGTSVFDLLRAVLARTGDFHLDLIDLNLRWIVEYEEDLIALLGPNRARIRSIQLPLQSGSDRILQLMRRGHDAADAERVMKALRAALPDVDLGTHALVGFPSETERDFGETMRILAAVDFDKVDVFAYADRPDTEAARMPDKVPAAVIRQRSTRLHRAFAGRDPGVAGLKHLVRETTAALQRRRKPKAHAVATRTPD